MNQANSDHARDKQKCVDDIADGRPKIYWHTRASWGNLLTTIVAERFNVIVEHLGDITTEAENLYHQGYNDATIAMIDASFGQGAFQSLLDDVERFRRLAYQRQVELKQ